jgi:transcriptional regulator with XRE-family HTH domain
VVGCRHVVDGRRVDAQRLGNEVRRRRRVLGWTLEQLAEVADLSPNYVGKVERGEVDASLSTLLKLANAFETPLGLFVGGAAPNLGPAGLEIGLLFEKLPEGVQDAVAVLMRAASGKSSP